ncbi:MAG: TatD family hydrolase [Oscillospiraceae bacterium]|nr:TatD family hydrolase [Oscillospiraceae bacterium]
MFIDTHAHYDDAAYDDDRDAVLMSLADSGVAHVVNAGSDLASSEVGRDLSACYAFMWYAAGIHPHAAADAPPGFEGALTALLDGEKAVALGEIGLDYHYDYSPRGKQREVFERQLVLAGRLKVPVIIHDREAHDDVMDMLRAHRQHLRGGVLHCFTGDRRLAERAVDIDFYIAFGGAITFKNSQDISEAAAYVPPDRLLLETDCPYMSPAPFRGRRNDSTKLGVIARRMAEIRGRSEEYIAQVTAENAKRLFSIP